MTPLFGRFSPAIVVRRVDLPAPLGPINVAISPSFTSSDIPRLTTIGPYGGPQVFYLEQRHDCPPRYTSINLRVAKDRLCRTVGDLVAEMKHYEMTTQLGHHPDVMVDEADADAELVDAAKELNQFDAFRFIEPRGWFIEQELRRMSS